MLFTGRLTANAEVTNLKGDKKVTNFTVALNQRFKTKGGEKRERTAYIDCAYWLNAGLAEYLTKGAVVEISGWVDAESWKDKKGEAHARLTCNVDNVKLFSSAPKVASEAAKPEKEAVGASASTSADDDDLPF